MTKRRRKGPRKVATKKVKPVMAPPKAEPTEAEVFTMERQDLFEFLYWDERVGRLHSEVDRVKKLLVNETAHRDQHRAAMNSKYTENGKYNLVGSIDRDTAQGRRVLVKPPESSEDDPSDEDEGEDDGPEDGVGVDEEDEEDEEDDGTTPEATDDADVISLSDPPSIRRKKQKLAKLRREQLLLETELSDGIEAPADLGE